MTFMSSFPLERVDLGCQHLDSRLDGRSALAVCAQAHGHRGAGGTRRVPLRAFRDDGAALLVVLVARAHDAGPDPVESKLADIAAPGHRKRDGAALGHSQYAC